MKHLLFFLSFFLCFNMSAQGTSPKINSDKSVTFTFSIPEADEVDVKGDFIPYKYKVNTKGGAVGIHETYEMTKENDTTWTYTTPVLEPDLYMYRFSVDGEEDGDSLDPQNPNKFRDVSDYYNWFIIPGGTADYYLDDSSIAHGTIEMVWYPTQISGMKQRRMSVYLPPDYDNVSAVRYPVLYLFHGTGGDETAWLQCGRAVQILDNMIARKKIEPLIVVMPNSNCNIDAAPGESPYMQTKPSSNNIGEQFGRFESTFIGDIVNYVDSNYNTIADKAHRAIAGLSLGGMQTIYISANNPDMFDYIGLFSAQTEPYFSEGKRSKMMTTSKVFSNVASKVPFFGAKLSKTADRYHKSLEGLEIYDNIDEKLDTLFSGKPKLYYIACGKDDFVKHLNDNFREKLTKKKYPFIYNESEGAHTWSNWRQYLIDFLPRLFKKNHFNTSCYEIN